MYLDLFSVLVGAFLFQFRDYIYCFKCVYASKNVIFSKEFRLKINFISKLNTYLLCLITDNFYKTSKLTITSSFNER